MADHARTQCRDAALALLDSLTTTGARAYAGRPSSHPLQQAELDVGPVLLIYTNEEESELTAGQRGTRRKARACQLMVHGFAQDSTDLDKLLDTIAKEVEAALEADPTLGGKAKDCYHTKTEKNDESEGKAPTGEVLLTFTCEYDTREGTPDALLP
jgi:hypothetical protein